MFAACATGCQRSRQKRLTEEDIHRITREFVFAANSAAPRGSEVHGEVGAFDKVANSSDLVEIHIFTKRHGKDYPPSVTRLLDELNGIATAHGLTPDPQTENGDAVFLNYRHAGVITHTVHIHFAGSTDVSHNSDSAPATSHTLPLAKAHGVKLVFASELVREILASACCGLFFAGYSR